MNWNKLKKQLEEFLNPALEGRVTYSQSGYQYTGDKKNQNHILVDKLEVLNTREQRANIIWYENEMAIKKDPGFRVYIDETAVDVLREQNKNIPEDRLRIIAEKNKENEVAKLIYKGQQDLFKSDFRTVAAYYLTSSVNECLASDDILLNIFAIMDRRVGKNRLKKMSKEMWSKHACVNYFYELRLKS